MNFFIMHLFSTLSALTVIYSILCIIRLFLSWIPSLAYSKAGFILTKICDPYLNIFRHLRFLTFGGIDFSPALALCVLSAVSSLFKTLSHGIPLSPAVITAVFISLLETIILSIISFVILILVIRIIILIINPYSSSPVLNYLDRTLQPFASKIARTFSFGKKLSYTKTLIIAAVFLTVVMIAVIIILKIVTTLLLFTPQPIQ